MKINLRYFVNSHHFKRHSLPIIKFASNSSKILPKNTEMSYQVREQLKNIFVSAVNAVKPHIIIENKIKIIEDCLIIEEKHIPLRKNVYMVGFGKAVMGMALSLEKLLGNRLTSGIISIPRGSLANLSTDYNSDIISKSRGILKFRENSLNNQPDDDTLETTRAIMDLVKLLTNEDTLIVLISGGGSALLSMPLAPLNLKIELCKTLFNHGADIKEVNVIRQKLSAIKAGGLARLAYPANVIGLILSDIIGDPLELIASGPTVYSPKTPEAAIEILRKYNLFEDLPVDLKKMIIMKDSDNNCVLLNKENQFIHVHNFIIGNNKLAIEAARLECLRQSFHAIVLRHDVQGFVNEVSLMYTRLCRVICEVWNKSLSQRDFIKLFETLPELLMFNKRAKDIYEVLKLTKGEGLVLIAGGELEVLVTGNGKGGRNQELALCFAVDWFNTINNNPDLKLNMFDVLLLSAGTDGQDGPTDAAGAFGYSEINSIFANLQNKIYKEYAETQGEIKMRAMRKLTSFLPENILKNNDTYNFYSKFRNGRDLLKTGITGTNVMDLHLIYIKMRSTYSNEINEDEHDFLTDFNDNSN